MAVKIKHFVGIDVSKAKLDIVILCNSKFISHEIVDNNHESILCFLDDYKKRKGFTIKNSLFCMEETGIYTAILARVLEKAKANFVIENAYHIKHSLGTKREKSDKIDAHGIAVYAFKNCNELNLHSSRRTVIEQLKLLEKLRTRIIGLRVALNNPLSEQAKYLTNAQYL